MHKDKRLDSAGRSRKRLLDLHDQGRELLKVLASCRSLIKGSVYDLKTRCGKPSCACAQGGAAQRDGAFVEPGRQDQAINGAAGGFGSADTVDGGISKFPAIALQVGETAERAFKRGGQIGDGAPRSGTPGEQEFEWT